MKGWRKQGGTLAFGELPEPAPRPDEVLIAVEAVSLNRGEVRTVANAKEGLVPGWDVAGTVVEEAAGGGGPKKGTRVAAILPRGGWAERAAVPLWNLAAIPDGVSSAVASTLPVAGLTVVRALGVAGPMLGRRALITGASGGVGTIATQLAALAGAEVTGISREEPPAGEFDFILESVGGASLAMAIERVARGGVVVTIGMSSEEPTTFNARTLFAKGGASIYGLIVFEEVESRRTGGADLAMLLALVRDERLRVPLHVERSWRELPEVLSDLGKRRFTGKAVCRVGAP